MLSSQDGTKVWVSAHISEDGFSPSIVPGDCEALQNSSLASTGSPSTSTVTGQDTAGPRPVPYPGSGTEGDPYIVSWLPDEPDNPFNWSGWRKEAAMWSTTAATFAVALSSSAYSGAVTGLLEAGMTENMTVVILGLSLYVLGFALGPLLWGPLSEM